MFKVKNAEFGKMYTFGEVKDEFGDSLSLMRTYFEKFVPTTLKNRPQPQAVIICRILIESDGKPIKAVRGIAKCKVEDEYNEEYGKLLAFRKALVKANKVRQRCHKEIIDTFVSTIDTIKVSMEKDCELVNLFTRIVDKKTQELYSE